jgi:RNA polymerase sigma-70 factor (ECF subfamily)
MSVNLQTVVFGGWAPVRDEPVTVPGAGADVSADDLSAADDAALVEAFRRGRREAFDVIVARHQRSVYGLCYRFTGNHEDASDLAQDVFVRAFRGLHQFKATAALGTWLHRIGVNTALNRNALRRLPAASLDGTDMRDGRLTDPVDHLDAARRSALVRRAILQLPPKQRATIILRVYHDLPYDQIASTLGTSVGAAKANIFHALGTLKRLLRS